MAKINFKEFKMFTDIGHESTRVFDIRKDFSNGMYVSLRGIQSHDIAMRIYKSDGEVEFSDEELQIIMSFAQSLTGAFIDSMSMNIKN
jgi:hypothetical protein